MMVAVFTNLSPRSVTLIVDDDFSDDEDSNGDKYYKTLSKALANANCGDTVILKPGTYDETINFRNGNSDNGLVGEKNCTKFLPLTIRAENLVIAGWKKDEIGAGSIIGCILNGIDYNCDYSKVSYVNRFSTTGTNSNANIYIEGIETHYIGFASGCRSCRVTRNFFNVNFNKQIVLPSSDNSVIAGNHGYRAGGDSSGDMTFSGYDSKNLNVHHNNLYGVRGTNGAGFNNDDCTESNWKTACKDDFLGTDGWTVDNENECGTRFHHNKIYNLSYRYNSTDDGDAIDLKKMNCSDDPSQFYNNEIYNNAGTGQIVIHRGAKGARFYNNTIRNGDGYGVYFQAGQECSGSDDYGYINDHQFLGNFIYENGLGGIKLRHKSSSTCLDYREIYNIGIVSNSIINNGGYGIHIDWLSDDQMIFGISVDLTNTIQILANELISNSDYQIVVGNDFIEYVMIDGNIITGVNLIGDSEVDFSEILE